MVISWPWSRLLLLPLQAYWWCTVHHCPSGILLYSFLFLPPWQPGQGLYVPSVLMFQFDPKAHHHWAIFWVLICKTGCATTTTQQDWQGGNTIPMEGQPSASSEHLYSERNAAAIAMMSQHRVWAKSSLCSFAVKICDRLVTNHPLLLQALINHREPTYRPAN